MQMLMFLEKLSIHIPQKGNQEKSTLQKTSMHWEQRRFENHLTEDP